MFVDSPVLLAVGSMIIILTVALVVVRWVTGSSRQGDSEESEESKLNSFIHQNLYFLSSRASKELLSINIAMFEQPLLKITLFDIPCSDQ